MSEQFIKEESQALVPHNLHHPAYSSIASENGEIRLLELLPGKYDDPLSMRLLPKKSNEDIEYEALSYAWGTTDSPHEALLDGTPTSMRTSLDLGLRRLRYAEKSRILWVDALCINQNDVQERSHQVQQMEMIYSSATTVLIWLGELPSSNTCQDQERCEKAFSELLTESRRINLMLGSATQDKLRFSMMSKFLKQNELFYDIRHFMGHLSDTCSQPWFRRLWIIQEFILAREDPVIHTGRHVARWLDFFYAIKMSRACWVNFRRGVKGVYPQLFAMEDFWKMRHTGTKKKKTLMWWLSCSFDSGATDNRDKIYGLLGICDFQVADPIIPDYSKSFQQVLAETLVVDILERSPVRYLERPLTPIVAFDRDLHRPSWLFDEEGFRWSPEMRRPLILSSNERKRRNSLLRLSEDGRTLFTQGRYIGTISAVLSCVTTGDDSKEKARLVAELCEFYHKVLKPINITPQRLFELVRPNNKTYGDSNEFAAHLSGVGNEAPSNIEIREFGSMKRQLCKDDPGCSQTLIVTEEGDLGMTWHVDQVGLQAGDIVVNLFGYNVPIILRPSERAQVHVMLNIAQFDSRMGSYGYDWVRFEDVGREEYVLI
ncbi:hypothetical protein AA0111_g11768 [Alternaria arborescens]|uniref:hypothetical protein n=1 Tax=Alternaria arborescens TaxID=156630 RepID=UPI001074E7F4|nr:hypothetical protein AA0111_g11768 [Alternaria arborescens]RYO15162.1 hypothetical protein AA0111_g11768 [Alternaria arborescens]